jgi:hypothetical protein
VPYVVAVSLSSVPMARPIQHCPFEHPPTSQLGGCSLV